MVNSKSKTIIIVCLAIVLVLLAGLSLLIGQYGLSISETLNYILKPASGAEAQQIIKIIRGIRVPRTLAAIVIGGSLAVSGLTYQSVFRNRLASQDILGVSTGACVGAAIGIILDFSGFYIQIISFVFGLLTIGLVFLLSHFVRTDKTLSLVLSGILIGGVMSSILGLLKYLANPETHLQSIIFWTMGDLSSVSIPQLGSVSFPIGVSLAIVFLFRWRLNIFSFSDKEAKTLGVNISALRILLILSATFIVAADVSISGSIGWIGLVIPQLARMTIGTNNTQVVPTTFFMGGIFLLIVDIINRLVSAAELPVSIISGVLGLPVFILCLYTNKLSIKENAHS